MEKKVESVVKKSNSDKPAYKFDHYKSLHTWSDTPVNDAWKDQLAQELYQWSRDDEDAYKLSQFYLSRGINNRDFTRWCQEHENLKEAREAALALIGNRREIGGLKKKLDTNIVLSSMSRYDLDWKELAEWRAQLKSESENKSETKIIVMESFNPPPQKSPEEVAKKARNGMIGKSAHRNKPRKKK